jgi:exodeoxyribonuclease V alpha subunit
MDLFEHADAKAGVTNTSKNTPQTTSTPKVTPNTPVRNPSFSRPPNSFARPMGSPRPSGAVVQPTSIPEMEEVCGRIVHRIFRSPDTGYCVVAISLDGKGDATLQATTSLPMNKGDRIVAKGTWATYKGKPQFKADSIEEEIARGAKGAVEWLKAKKIKGVGPGTIAKLEKKFGHTLPDVLHDADLMTQAIATHLADTIARTYKAAQSTNKLETELRKSGLKSKQVFKVIEMFGARSLKIIETNPWMLMDIEGIGFLTADRIALTNGLSRTCDARMMAGLKWVLLEILKSGGHCGVPRDKLIHSGSHMLEVEYDVIEAALHSFIDGTKVIHDEDVGLIYPRIMWEAERESADKIAALLARSQGAKTRNEAEEAVTWAEKELGKKLDRDTDAHGKGGQFEAAVTALSTPVCIITGGPGTGKSTTQEIIVKALTYFGREANTVSLAAPTGRAAKRLSETSGREAKTIHRLLEFSPSHGGFVYGKDKPLTFEVVIVDEYSMVDLRLFSSLMDALGDDACHVIVGDFDQLPSVGEGQVLHDLIVSGVVPVIRLNKVHRTAEGSGIAIAAQRINKGLTPSENGKVLRGFSVRACRDEDLIDAIVRMVRHELPEMGFDPMRDVQVLAGQKKGDFGVRALNMALKAALNPADDNNSVQIGFRPAEDGGGSTGERRQFTVGDRVMQMKNDYNKGVYNGEVGSIIAVGAEPDANGARRPYAIVDFSGTEARYTAEDHLDLEFAYAATVHKSQGAEFPVVIFAAPSAHRRMLNRNLLYTGVTRARTECIVIGNTATIDEAPSRMDGSRRHTALAHRLQAAYKLEIEHGR